MSNFMSTIKATVTTSHQQQLPSWVDDSLEASATRRGPRRSSAYDSITFLETQFLEECQSSNHGDGAATARTTAHGFDVLDEDQLICMFSDDIALPPPLPSNRNSNNNEKPMALNANVPMQEHDDQLSKNEVWAAAAMEPHSATPRRVKR